MSEADVIYICRHALTTALMIAGPMLLAGLVVGLVMSIFQAVTSVNEQTMTLIPKILVVAGTLAITFPWIIQTMVEFTEGLYAHIGNFVR